MELGDVIRSLRQTKKMTQKELADRLAISPSTIGMYEQNRRVPDIDTVSKIANIFDISVDYLLGNDNAGIDYQHCQMDAPEFGSDFKCRLKEVLKEKGISDQDFRKVTGFHSDDANAYLHGNRIPSIEDLIKLSASLHVSADCLLGINETEQIPEIDRYFLKTLTDRERNIIDVYRQLNEDNQDIIFGEMKKFLKEQRYESVTTNNKYLDTQGKSFLSNGTEDMTKRKKLK